MSNTLSLRLRRLEQRSDIGNRYANWTDEDLENRIAEVTQSIEAEVGMPLAAYADTLVDDLNQGLAPAGMTIAEARSFVSHVKAIRVEPMHPAS